MAERSPSPLPCPVYLGGALARRWEDLAPELQRLGTLDALNVDIAGKYILAENEYTKISAMVQQALVDEDADAAVKWINAQDRITKQILQLGAELGITPKARRDRGLGR